MHALADDGSLVPVFAHRGPFVTVYLDCSHGPADGADVIDERWASVRETLDGADPDSLDAIEESLTAEFADTGAHGLVAVAADGELCLSARLATPPVTAGFHTPLPHLLPYVSARPPQLPNIVIAGAAQRSRILRYVDGDLALEWTAPAGDGEPGSVARVVAHRASQLNPDIVVVAGAADQRASVVAALESVLVPDVVVRPVPVAPEDTGLLRAAVESALRDYCREDGVAMVQRIRRLAGDRDRVATGIRDVAAALRMAQVDSVVLVDGPHMDQRCWIGPRPTEFGLRESEAAAVGLRSVRHDRAGSALIRAVFATGCRLATVEPDGWMPQHGVAALLR